MNLSNKETFVIVLITLILYCVSATVGYGIAKGDMKREAISANAAHWEITTNGTPVFVWGMKQ